MRHLLVRLDAAIMQPSAQFVCKQCCNWLLRRSEGKKRVFDILSPLKTRRKFQRSLSWRPGSDFFSAIEILKDLSFFIVELDVITFIYF